MSLCVLSQWKLLSEGLQKLHQTFVFAPRLLWLFVLDLAGRQGFGLHFHVHLGVKVRGVDGDVAKPTPNRVDIVPGPEEVCRRCMADCVWAHAFLRHRR